MSKLESIFLSVYVLKLGDALIACGLYILLGAVGLPVFSGMAGGPAKLFGPTGGYIFGYFLLILIASPLVLRSKKSWQQAGGLALGTAACYALGTAWLAFQAHLSFEAALMAGVIPFIPADIIKIILIIIVGPKIKQMTQI